MPSSHVVLDQVDIAFDDARAVAAAGLLLPATLAERLGTEQATDELIDLGDRPGAARPGRKLLTLVHAMLAGGRGPLVHHGAGAAALHPLPDLTAPERHDLAVGWLRTTPACPYGLARTSARQNSVARRTRGPAVAQRQHSYGPSRPPASANSDRIPESVDPGLVVTVLLASCSGTGDRADNTTTPGPVTTQAAATGQIDGSFDAGGHKLHLRCEARDRKGRRPWCTRMAWAATAPT
jgi:hypothetical protein